ncbi:hypothetical protein [Novosphingobium sp.]|jgi:hypothetical protein|uniref:hypothetical protein n=1 Tax=Novosphingobium sp. TaxID=1874826 RepID=UPI002FE002B8
MTHLTIDHERPAQCQPVPTGDTKATRGLPFSVVACWQWLVAISQVAVDHRYAAPWDCVYCSFDDQGDNRT